MTAVETLGTYRSIAHLHPRVKRWRWMIHKFGTLATIPDDILGIIVDGHNARRRGWTCDLGSRRSGIWPSYIRWLISCWREYHRARSKGYRAGGNHGYHDYQSSSKNLQNKRRSHRPATALV